MATAGRRIGWNVLKGIATRHRHGARIISSFCAGNMHKLPCKSEFKSIKRGLAAMGMEGETIAKRWMSCCSRLDAPPPRQVMIEYSEEGDNTDYFIQIADAIEEAYPEVVVLGNPEDMLSRKGSFEVTMDGQLLFSKLKENRLPNIKEILVAIDALPLPCQQEVCSSA
ncbi:hypothetical protein SUGI_0521090 [Cryptomeria japonica]|nr:hypothetical protein SUGI_0521090 [Cryptomeria japonica]